MQVDIPDLVLQQFTLLQRPNGAHICRRPGASGNSVHARGPADRLWHFHRGTGIVETPDDFACMGDRPLHPQLLAIPALQRRENGWRIKAMHRLIMLSDIDRQSSAFREQAAGVNGDSRPLGRFPPRRLSAEEVRDEKTGRSRLPPVPLHAG